MKRAFAIAIACCAFALTLGLVACGGSSGSSAASGSTASAGGASGGADGASAEAAAAGYLDENGFLTVKAFIELDGAELTKVAEAAGYKWDEKHASWTRVGSDVSPMKARTHEDYSSGNTDADFTSDEIAALPVGAKGVPMEWFISNRVVKYDDAADLLDDQQVTVVDQCEVEHRNYGKEIWAVVVNSAGDRYLLEVRHYDSDGSGVIEVYSTDYIATESRGVASSFNMGDYLLEDAHTIDAIMEVIRSGEVS